MIQESNINFKHHTNIVFKAITQLKSLIKQVEFQTLIFILLIMFLSHFLISKSVSTKENKFRILTCRNVMKLWAHQYLLAAALLLLCTALNILSCLKTLGRRCFNVSWIHSNFKSFNILLKGKVQILQLFTFLKSSNFRHFSLSTFAWSDFYFLFLEHQLKPYFLVSNR